MHKLWHTMGKKLGFVSLLLTGTTLIILPAQAENNPYQNRYQGNYTPTPYGNTQYGSHNNANPSGYYHQAHYGRPPQPQILNSRPPYPFQPTYPSYAPRPTYANYPVYHHNIDYRYGYTTRPHWYGRMHRNEYQVMRRDGRDFYYLQPNIYSSGVVIGRPQPGVVLMQYPDRTLEIIEATRLILDVMYRR